MRLLRGLGISGLSMLLFSSKFASAEEHHSAVIWYRASEECPGGAEFLARLPSSGAPARLADAGDHIDFVVTLVAVHGRTAGRLERQTHEGTVAMRELSDPSCAKVADALALSLGLALEPQSAAAAAPEASAAPVEVLPPTPTPEASTIGPEAPAGSTSTPRTQNRTRSRDDTKRTGVNRSPSAKTERIALVAEQAILSALKEVQKRHSLPPRSFHSLRHYFLSALVRGGANLEAVRELAGHSKLLTTQRYLHASGADLRDAVSRLSR